MRERDRVKPDRTLDEVRTQFLALQREVGTLATEALHLRPTWRLVFGRRERLHSLEERLDAHFRTFMNLEADLVAHAQPPKDINSVILVGIQFQMHFGVRDSVRGVLADTNGILSGVRTQLDFRGSLAISIAAIVVALISAATDVSGVFGGK